MTELIELVHMGMITEKDIECPFHEPEHECKGSIKNDLVGDAETLGKKLAGEDASANSTVIRQDKSVEPYKLSYFETQKDPDAEYDYDTVRHVSIHEAIKCKYPIAYAAHHIIPAGASLRKAQSLLPYIEKTEGNKLCCNLGYDVNGNQNGVWLPGLHAVNKNGIDVWRGKSTKLPDKEDWKKLVSASTKKDYLPLRGPKPRADPDRAFESLNLRWLYVQTAMNFTVVGKRQFHDAHPHYSSLIKKGLEDVGNRLKRLSTGSKKPKMEPTCPKCKENKHNGQKFLLPPLQLLMLLNKTSQFYKNTYLINKTQHEEYYTSRWCGPRPKKKTRRK